MWNRKTIISIEVLFLLAALIACAPSPAPVDYHSLKRRPQPKIVIAGLERKIHILINKERRKEGLSLLEWNSALADIARGHSRDMAKRNYFEHYSPEGHDYLYRYRQAGYTCAVREGRTIYEGAENIALNHLYDSVTTVNGEAFYDWNSEDKIAATTVQGWMKSPGHRKNILTPYFRSEGLGVVIMKDGKVYITQNFC